MAWVTGTGSRVQRNFDNEARLHTQQTAQASKFKHHWCCNPHNASNLCEMFFIFIFNIYLYGSGQPALSADCSSEGQLLIIISIKNEEQQSLDSHEEGPG